MGIMSYIPWAGMPLDFQQKMLQKKIIYIQKWTEKNISEMKRQLKLMGLSIDWDLEVSTCDENITNINKKFLLIFIKKDL